MAREVELKFKINDKNDFFCKMREKGIVLSEPQKQHDRIYMLEGKNFTDLKKGENIIRIREEGKKLTTTVKKYVDGIKDRQEVECGITNVKLFADYLNILGYKMLIEVIKERSNGDYLGAKITFDSVVGLGEFTEIEIVVDSDDTMEAQKLVEYIAKDFGFDILEQIKLPYDEMVYLERKKENND